MYTTLYGIIQRHKAQRNHDTDEDSDDKEAERTLIPAIHKRGIINTIILQWASF